MNVWVLRARSATSYRGGDAKTLKQEFEAYGLPSWAFHLVGGLKVTAAIILLAGLWMSAPVDIAAGVVAALMVGALTMHVKVGDPLMRSVPALLMLAMCLGILFLG